MHDLTKTVKNTAVKTGFDQVGIADPSDPLFAAAITRYQAWLPYSASMQYLKKHLHLKSHPEELLTNVKSIVCVAAVYRKPYLHLEHATAKVSQYTQSLDYHHKMMKKLLELSTVLKTTQKINCYPFVDSQPVLERFWAWRAGLGWIGKNAMLINRNLGSFFFIGGLLTDAVLQCDSPETDHCGKCRKCIDACPTGAIIESEKDRPVAQTTQDSLTQGHAVDSDLCIAYHTIENRSTIPEFVMSKSDRWIAGCDICQDVCPWNDKASRNEITGQYFNEIQNPAVGAKLTELASWSAQDFKEKLTSTAMTRMKYSGFLRNLTIAIHNSQLSKNEKTCAYDSIKKQATNLKDGPEKQAICSALEWAICKS